MTNFLYGNCAHAASLRAVQCAHNAINPGASAMKCIMCYTTHVGEYLSSSWNRCNIISINSLFFSRDPVMYCEGESFLSSNTSM